MYREEENENTKYMPIQQQQDDQQQQQYFDHFSFNELSTDFLNSQQFNCSELFSSDPYQWNMYNLNQDPLQTMNPQDAILFSDPNFLRQHQLLQQTEMTSPQNEHHQLVDNNDKKAQKQQHESNTTASRANQKPVPETTEDTAKKIDHQRRLNELQARFRVNQSPNKSSSFSSNRKAHQKLSSSASTYEVPNSIEIPLHQPPWTMMAARTPPPVISTFSAKKEEKEQFLSSSLPSSSTRTMPIQIQRVSRPNHPLNMDAASFQKRLDDELIKIDFDDITVSELKDMLKQRGKPATGRKSILVQRLQDEKALAKKGRHNRQSVPIASNHHYVDQRPKSFHEGYEQTLPLGSPGGQLSRSIANMHIGSPRHYSPYSSPRSPKKSPLFEYSTQSATSPTMDPTRLTPGRYNTKSYKPITPSALATPDCEDEDINPFDAYYGEASSATTMKVESDGQQYDNSLDWASLELLLQDQSMYNSNKDEKKELTKTYDIIESMDMNQPLYHDGGTYPMSCTSNDGQHLSNEQFFSFLNNSPSYNFKLDESVLNNK